MNKEEIIKTLKKYNFDKNEYIVLSTASMVIQGLKEQANDIDIAVSPKLYNELLKKYQCKSKSDYENVYTFDKIDFGTNYFDQSNIVFIDDIPLQSIPSVLKLKQNLNRDKDLKDIEIINNYLNTIKTNSLVLAYLGDAIYELYIRKYLIKKGLTKVNELQSESIKYVSAKAQSEILEKMINDNFFKEDELSIIKRARNHKSHSNKSTDIVTYKKATGLEALIGYLDLQNNNKRIKEIMNYIVGD